MRSVLRGSNACRWRALSQRTLIAGGASATHRYFSSSAVAAAIISAIVARGVTGRISPEAAARGAGWTSVPRLSTANSNPAVRKRGGAAVERRTGTKPVFGGGGGGGRQGTNAAGLPAHNQQKGGRHADGGQRVSEGKDALRGPQTRKRPQQQLGRRLEEVAEAFGGGFCRLQMPLKLAPERRGGWATGWAPWRKRGGGHRETCGNSPACAVQTCG